MDSSVPWALLSIGSSSGCDPENPYVVIPSGRVNLESVNPVLMAGTNWMSSLSNAFCVAVWRLAISSVSNSDEFGSAI